MLTVKSALLLHYIWPNIAQPASCGMNGLCRALAFGRRRRIAEEMKLTVDDFKQALDDLYNDSLHTSGLPALMVSHETYAKLQSEVARVTDLIDERLLVTALLNRSCYSADDDWPNEIDPRPLVEARAIPVSSKTLSIACESAGRLSGSGLSTADKAGIVVEATLKVWMREPEAYRDQIVREFDLYHSKRKKGDVKEA